MNDKIECPYCSCLNPIIKYPNKNEFLKVNCDWCKKTFGMTAEVTTYMFTTESKPPSQKVFCNECKYFKYNYSSCDHPNNIKIEVFETWQERSVERKDISCACKINANNDCGWFVSK